MNTQTQNQTQTGAGVKAPAPQSGVSAVKYADGSVLNLEKFGIVGRTVQTWEGPAVRVFDVKLNAKISFFHPERCEKVRVFGPNTLKGWAFDRWIQDIREKYCIPKTVKVYPFRVAIENLRWVEEKMREEGAVVEV